MNDLVLSIGIKTNESGLKSLQSEIEKLGRKTQATEAAMKTATGQSLKDLQARYAKQTEHLELMRKAQEQLNNALNVAKLNGGQLNSEYIKLTRSSKDLVSVFQRSAEAIKDNAAAAKQLTAADLGGFLRGLDGALKQVTQSINKQTEAFRLQNEQKEKSIQLSNQQAEAARRAAAVAPIAAPAMPTPIAPPGKGAEKQGAGFIEKTGAIARQALISAPIYGGAYAATGQISAAVAEYVELDTVLTRIAIVSDMTVTQARALREEFGKSASSLGVSAVEYAKGAELFFAQGGKAAEYAKELTTVSIQLANATNSTAESTSEYVTAIGNSFKLIEKGPESIQKIGDTLLYLGNISASSASEIGDAMRRSASTFQSAGIDMETASAMIATSLQVTRLAPERVGTAFKTIVETIQEVKEAGPKEMKAFTNKIQQTIDQFPSLKDKLQIFDETGTQMVPTIDFLKQLQSAYSEIKDTDPMAISAVAQAIGGKENANVLAALLENKELFDRLYKGVSEDAVGKAAEAQAKYMESLKANLERLKNEFSEVIAELISPEAVKEIIDTLITGMHAFRDLLGDSNQLIKLIAIGIGLVVAKNALGALFSGLGGVVAGFVGKITGLNKLLGKGPEYDTSVFRNQTNQAKLTTEQLTQAIVRQNAALAQNRALLNNQDLTPEERAAIQQQIDTGQQRVNELREQGGSRRTPEEQAARRRRLMDLRGVSRYGRAVAAGRNLVSSVASGAAKFGGPIAAVVGGGISVASAVANGEDFGTALGGAAGSAAGSAAGAALGTLLLPGVGTVIGGMLGGLIGEKIGTSIAEAFKDKDKELQENLDKFKPLYEKLKQGGTLTKEEADEYERLNALLAENTALVVSAVAAHDELNKRKADLNKAEAEYVKLLNDPAAQQGHLNRGQAALAQATRDLAVAEQKAKMIEQLNALQSKEDTKLPQEEYNKILASIQSSTVKSFADIRKIVADNPNIFQGIKTQLINLENTAESSYTRMQKLGELYLKNAESLSKEGKIKGIKDMLSAFGLSNDIVDLSKTNAEALLAIYIRLATAQAQYAELVPNATKLKAQTYFGGVGDPELLALVQQQAADLAGTLGTTPDKIFNVEAGGYKAYDPGRKSSAQVNIDLFNRQIKEDQERLSKLRNKGQQSSGKGLLGLSRGPFLTPLSREDQKLEKEYLDRIARAQKEIAKNQKIVSPTGAAVQSTITGQLISSEGVAKLAGGMITDVDAKVKPIKTTATPDSKKTGATKEPAKLPALIKKQRDIAADEKRFLDSLDTQIRIVSQSNLMAEQKAEILSDKYDEKINMLEQIRYRYSLSIKEAMSDKNLAKVTRSDGKLNELSIQKRRDDLENYYLSLKKKYEDSLTKGDTKKTAQLEKLARGAFEAVKSFEGAITQYNKSINDSAEITDKLTKTLDEAKNKIKELGLTAIENSLAEIMFGKTPLDKIKEFYSITKEFQDEYLNDIEKGISLNKLSTKINQDILKTGTNPQLVAFQKRITDMKKDGKIYSESELKVLNSEYDVLLKSVALKQAEKNAEQQSSETQLMRDAEGNWVFAAKLGDSKDKKDAADEKASAELDLLEASEKFYKESSEALLQTQVKILENSDKGIKIQNDINALDLEISELKARNVDGQYDKVIEEKQALKEQLEKSLKILEDQVAAEKASAERLGNAAGKAAQAAAVAAVGSETTKDLIGEIINSAKGAFDKIPENVKELVTNNQDELKKIQDPFKDTIADLTRTLQTNEKGIEEAFKGIRDKSRDLLYGFTETKDGVKKVVEGLLSILNRLENESLIANKDISYKQRLGIYAGNESLKNTELERIRLKQEALKEEIKITKNPARRAAAQQELERSEEHRLNVLRGSVATEIPKGAQAVTIRYPGEIPIEGYIQNGVTYDMDRREINRTPGTSIITASGEIYDILNKDGKGVKRGIIPKGAAPARITYPSGTTVHGYVEKGVTYTMDKKPLKKTPGTKVSILNAEQSEVLEVYEINEKGGTQKVSGFEEFSETIFDRPESGNPNEGESGSFTPTTPINKTPETPVEPPKPPVEPPKPPQWGETLPKPDDISIFPDYPQTNDPRVWDNLLKRVYGPNSQGYSYWREMISNGNYPTPYQLANRFDTGGYTGNFSGGKIGILHSKELVLNKQDTENLLGAVKVNRMMFSSNPFSAGFALNKNGSESMGNLTINASFPNVSSADEIRKAFANMSNNASQYVYKMRTQQY